LLDKAKETNDEFEAAGNQNPITFVDVLRKVDDDKSTRRRYSEYVDVVRNRIRTLLNTTGECLSCIRGFDIHKLAQTSFVLDLTGLPVEVQTFIISILIITLTHARMALGQIANKLNLAIVLDECMRLFPVSRYGGQDKSLSSLGLISHSVREFGIGLLAATQSPTSISEASVRSQSWLKAILGTLGSTSDWENMSDIMNFSEEQLGYAKKHARVGQAIVKLATGDFQDPMIITTPNLDLKRLDK